MTRLVVAAIRASALQQNLAVARQAAPDCSVMAVIKANAYGHGLLETARILESADALAVARLHEAIRLRDGGVQAPLVCLSGFADADELALSRRHAVQPVIHAPYQIELLEQCAKGESLDVWLKIDTGMGRLGIGPDEARAAIARLTGPGDAVRCVGLMTHLACADVPGDDATIGQIQTFGGSVGGWQGDISIANSAGILGWPDCTKVSKHLAYAGRNWIRPGLMLYGVSPFDGRSAADLGLRPAMSLQARVISVRNLVAGQAVGYGSTWRADRASRVAVLGIGYGDGLPWRAAGGVVAFDGVLAPIVGRISMDMITIDVTDSPQVNIGDNAVIWGDEVPVESVARQVGTIPYELLTGVTERVVRRYSD